MRLIAARLERVRQHRQLELDFAAGLTLIGGPNEAGKSTIVEALHKVLFLKATATGRGVEELRSLTHGGLPEVELRFEAGGQIWQLRKRFAGAGGTCQLSSDGGTTLQGSSAETRLAALLQVPGPVEGRRIAQLPLRWAHLWVRQGQAGGDPLAAGPEAYDLGQLVQQLQQAGSAEALQATASALESPRDRQVQQLLQQRLDLQLTATGKVRAGSPLALALAREAEAQAALQQGQARLADLDAALEQLRQIAEWLTAIEAESVLLDTWLRLQRETEPLQQRHQQLQLALHQWQGLLLQQQADQAQLAQLQPQLAQQQLQRQQIEQAAADGSRQRQALEQRSQALLRQQDLLSAQADLASLGREQEQLLLHKARFDGLQQQATAIKEQLQQLPAIGSAEVRQLRQAEQGHAIDTPPPPLAELDQRQLVLKQELQDLGQQRAQLERELSARQQQGEQLERLHAQHQAEAGRLAGSLAATEQQLLDLQRQHDSPQQLEHSLSLLNAQLQSGHQQLQTLEQQLGPAASDGELRLRQLAAEREMLLTNRGQQEQICHSLGALGPALALELQQAELEQAQADRQALERSTTALQLLLQAFAEAQQQSASHYCLPLQQALQGYLDALGLATAATAPLQFTPQQGFGTLQLQRQQQRFDFAQLSGGMREQLAAALRLALAELLRGAYDGCLPLVLDDAFSNSDPERHAGVLRMLERGVHQGVQVLLFSCTPEAFAPLAERLGGRVMLEPPTGDGL